MGVMVKEELCEKVEEVRHIIDRMMTVVVVFEEDVMRLICGYGSQIEISLFFYSLFTMR